MIDKPLSQLKAFFKKSAELKLTGSDQLMYLHLWDKFNTEHYPETLRITDAELQKAMRLYDTNGKPSSVEVLRRGRQRLRTKGLIDFNIDAGCAPTYKLIKLYESQAEKKISPSPVSEIELDEEIMHAWIQANGENPYGGYLEDLITRQKRYGAKAVADAINRCRRKRTFGELISMNFLDAELLRGGEKNGKIVSISAKSKSTVEDWERERADTFFDD